MIGLLNICHTLKADAFKSSNIKLKKDHSPSVVMVLKVFGFAIDDTAYRLTSR